MNRARSRRSFFVGRPFSSYTNAAGAILQLRGQSLALGAAGLGLLVQRLRDRRRTAPLAQAANDENMLIGPDAKADLVARLDRLGGFGALAVDLDLSAGDASVANDRVLKNRAAQSHLSSRTESMNRLGVAIGPLTVFYISVTSNALLEAQP